MNAYKKHSQNNTRKKDSRASFTLHLSARQGDLLKDILSRELTNIRSGKKDAKEKEITEILASVQNSLDQLEYFVRMRDL